MQYANLGRTGLKISRLVFGGAHIGELVNREKTEELVGRALDSGITTFYTSNDYNGGDAERFLGGAIKSRRDDVVIIAKTGYRVGTSEAPLDKSESYTNQRLDRLDYVDLWEKGIAPTSHGQNRKNLTAALDASLKRLGTDYIDVYAPHFWDPSTPIEETLDTLGGFVRAGKVRYLGCSQTAPWQLYLALWTADKLGLPRYEFVQLRCGIVERAPFQDELPALTAAGVGSLVINADGGGLFNDKYVQLIRENRGQGVPQGGGRRQRYLDVFWNEQAFNALDKLQECADQFGRNLHEMTQGWALAQTSITGLLISPFEPNEFDPFVKAAENPLTPDEMAHLDSVVATLPLDVRSTIEFRY